jgi:hypothetical protein
MRREEAFARIVAALRALPDREGLRARLRLAAAALARRPDTLLAVAVGVGVLAMILHWR